MKKLLDYVEDAQTIVCAISLAPIPYCPIYVDGYKTPVSLDVYGTYLESHQATDNIISITDPSKKLKLSDIDIDHKLDNTIRKIHRAIEEAIAESRIAELNEFLQKTAFDLDSPIQTDVGNRMHSRPPRTKTIAQLIDQAKELSNPAAIDEERLNTIHEDGYSLLHELTAYKGGLQILQDNLELVNKISSEALNHLDKYGYSPAHNLAIKNVGMKILTDNPGLVAKISSKTLNNFDCYGHTLLYWIIINQGGIDLLRQNPQLTAMISPEALNHLNSKYSKGLTYTLIKDTSGRKLLEENPQILGMISPEALATFGLKEKKILENNQILLNMIPNKILEEVYSISISEDGKKTLSERIFPPGFMSLFALPVTAAVATAYYYYNTTQTRDL